MQMKSNKAQVGYCIVTLVLLLLAFSMGRGIAYAGDGDLDFSFDGDGLVTTNFQDTVDEVHALTIQPDGKIVAVGTTQISDNDYDFSVARYNSDGSPDTTFGGGDGRVTTDSYNNHDDVAEAVEVQPDGKIVVVGHWVGNNFVAVRYNPDGSLDTSFGGTGIVHQNIALYDAAFAVAIQDDGKIVMAGRANPLTNNNTNFCVMRMNPDGSLDNSFDGDGKLTTDFFGGVDEAHAVAIQEGKILVAGYAQVNGFNYDFALARYNLNGSLDNTFGGGDGKVLTDFFGGDDGALSMVLQPDGKIVAAGAFYSTGQGYDFGLVRYHPNGDLDTSFDNDGLQAINFVAGTGTEVALGVTRQPYDGKIVAVGYAPVGGVNDFALVRLNLNGSLDSSFGVGGKLSHDFGGGVAIARGVAVQADGKIVAAGYAYMGDTNSYDYALARYVSGNISNPTSTPAPNVTPTSCPVQFTDVPPGSTFYDFVRCLACRQIVSGYPGGTFGPGNNVTRGQLSKIVANSAGYAENQPGQSFEDVPIGSTFHQFIERLFSRGYISGYPCGGPNEPCVPPGNRPYFRPNNPVTRGQTAKIVASAAGLPAPPPGLWTFQDVPQGSTFWEWIESLSSSGAITGYPCGGEGEPCIPPDNRYYFRPANNVTRGQSAKILANTFFPGCQSPANVGK
jgi:uncharacterized delta-60 repeat protein